MNVLSDIDIKPQDGDPLAVAIGDDEIHLLYQAMRDDVTGLERVAYSMQMELFQRLLYFPSTSRR